MVHPSRLAASALVLIFGLTVAWSSPSGLNNIPTADVVSRNVLVLQQWTAFGANRTPS